MPDYLMLVLALLGLLLVFPIFHFLTTQGTRKLSRRESTWLIILSVITLSAIAIAFYTDAPRW